MDEKKFVQAVIACYRYPLSEKLVGVDFRRNVMCANRKRLRPQKNSVVNRLLLRA